MSRDSVLRQRFVCGSVSALLFAGVLLAGCSGGSRPAVATQPAVAAPTNLSYAQGSMSSVVGMAIQPDSPTVTGTVSGYSVSPSLPAGLSVDGMTGVVSGTPTSPSAQAN